MKADKKKLTTIARLIINVCTHEEIMALCIAMLDAEMKVRGLHN